MVSARTSSAIFILLCSVVHSAMAYEVYYGSWYLYVWIPLLIIAIIRCCCYLNRKREPEQRIVYVDGVPADQTQTTINTTQVTAGISVVIPPEQAPPYGQHQGPVINSAYTPGPGDAYPPQKHEAAMYPPASGANAAYPPPPPGYSEAVKLPNYQSS
ncbi:uncharacterized protein LOC121406160 [Lytechinus variegatus]|uniref:uncharacterized protein LOC121406160 n=1 Tax=Lytechinus variegatus TaxID=7654 RepID=UPI001BB228D7|nr:uncharacterized protein LOC121406160 [Lytechinus variegatus]XP_041453112.1 uncharacterized protein LOC121406160 [Lytechinus variegatus]